MGGLLTVVSLLGGRIVKKHDEEIKSIKDGIKDGSRLPAAQHTLNAAERIMESRERHRSTAAERVAEELRLQGQELDRNNLDHRLDRFFSAAEGFMGKLSAALSRLPTGDAKPKKGRTSARK